MKNEQPHLFKDDYLAQAYITSGPNGIPLLNRIHRVKRLSDKSIIEKGKIIIFKDERYRIIRFIDLDTDLGLECKSIKDKKMIEIPCNVVQPELLDC